MAGKVAASGCLLPFLSFGGIVALMFALRNASNAEATGRRVELRLALRMCPACAAEVSSWDVIRKAMRRTPVYRRLLMKYPECQLATVKAV